LLYVGIDDFDLFSDTYGFLNVRRILNFVSAILQQTIDHLGADQDFVGHVGKGDFVIIADASQAAKIAQTIKSRFHKAMELAYKTPKKPTAPSRKITRGQEPPVLLMNLSVGVVLGNRKRFSDIRSLAEAASIARRRDRQRRNHE